MGSGYASEIKRLHQSLRKSGLIALLLLYFALSGLSTAMDRVSGPEAKAYFTQVTTADRDGLESRISYVFGSQLDDLSPGIERASNETITQVANDLEKIAREWFEARFSLLGATLTVDLRIVAPLLPFAVVLTAAYCWLLSRKIALARMWSRQSAAESKSEVQRLLNNPSFREHPKQLATAAVLTLAAVLILYLINQMVVFVQLFSQEDRTSYLCAIASTIAWTWLYCAHITTAMRGRRLPERGWLYQLHRGLRVLRRFVIIRARKRLPRVQAGTGALLVLATLWMLTADDCGSARSGSEYFLHRNDASWFNGGPFGAISDIVMWPSYDVLVVASAIALLALLLSAFKGARAWIALARRGAWLASAVSRAALFMVACSICFYTGNNLGDGVAVLVWLCVTVWLWAARGRAVLRTRRELTLALILLPAALSFGLFAVHRLWSEGLIGVPSFAAGVLLQMRVYDWFGWHKSAAIERGELAGFVDDVRFRTEQRV